MVNVGQGVSLEAQLTKVLNVFDDARLVGSHLVGIAPRQREPVEGHGVRTPARQASITAISEHEPYRNKVQRLRG